MRSPRTGPWAAGAQVSQEPNYLMWAEQQNAAGGIDVKGVKRPIELISFDDRSEMETCIRTYEKLMGSDKVDLVLPPWGSTPTSPWRRSRIGTAIRCSRRPRSPASSST